MSSKNKDYDTTITIERRVTYHWSALTKSEKAWWKERYDFARKKLEMTHQESSDSAWISVIAFRKVKVGKV